MTAQMPRSKTSAPNCLGEDMRQSYLSPATMPAGIYDRAIGSIFGQILSKMAAPKKYQNCCFFLVVFVRLDTNAAMTTPKSLRKVTGLAGAAALAGATQAYGAIINVAPPT